MSTKCTAGQLEFHASGRRDVVANFDGDAISSDGGVICQHFSGQIFTQLCEFARTPAGQDSR